MPSSGDTLTWAALLAQWTTLARASLALPKDAAGDRWRDSIPPIIALQAVTHALGDLDRLSGDERALAIDKASLLIARHALELTELWRGEHLHRELSMLISDARAALAGARIAAYEWPVLTDALIGEHPAELIAGLLQRGFDGDLYVPAPGVTLFRTCPAVFAVRTGTGAVPDQVAALIRRLVPGLGAPRRVPALRMPYRQFDFARGRAVRDLVVDESNPDPDIRAGQPLLVPAILGGRPQSVALPPRRPEPQARLPLVWARSDAL